MMFGVIVINHYQWCFFLSSWDKPSNNLDHRGCDLQVVKRKVKLATFEKKEGIHLEKNNSQLRINEGYRRVKKHWLSGLPLNFYIEITTVHYKSPYIEYAFWWTLKKWTDNTSVVFICFVFVVENLKQCLVGTKIEMDLTSYWKVVAGRIFNDHIMTNWSSKCSIWWIEPRSQLIYHNILQ